MVEKFYPTRHTTIGSVIDAGLRIHAFWYDCGFDRDVDMECVGAELGRDHSVLPVYLVPKLHCPLCHGKNIGTVLVTEGSEVSGDQVKHLKARRRKES